MNRLQAVAVALLGLAIVSCEWPLGPNSNPNSIEGRVRVEVRLSDPTGAPTGIRTLDGANGVRVYLRGAVSRDSVRTNAGAYRFTHIPAGSWQLEPGVGGVPTDTTYLGIRPKDDLVIRDTLVLGRTGDLSASPNPFPFSTEIRFPVPVETRVRVQVTDLTGTVRRVLADRLFVAGLHVMSWDGRDDKDQPLPDGTYAIVFLSGSDRRCEIVAKGP